MFAGNINDLQQVTVESFWNVPKDLTFDVFALISEGHFVHVFSKATGMDYKRLAQYRVNGAQHLYVRKEDFEKWKSFVSKPIGTLIDEKGVSIDRKVALVLNLTEQHLTEVFVRLNVTDELATSTREVIHRYVDLMSKDPKALTLMLKMVSFGDYLYYHSIATSIFSIFLARAEGRFERLVVENIGLAGFLHDVGCAQIPKEIYDKADPLKESEIELLREHPKMSLQMIEPCKTIPQEVKYGVYQHHEQPLGRGYPNQLTKQSIYYPAQIVAVADAFSALLSDRPYRKGYNAQQAVKIIESEKGKYEKQIVELLASIFLRGTMYQKAG